MFPAARSYVPRVSMIWMEIIFSRPRSTAFYHCTHVFEGKSLGISVRFFFAAVKGLRHRFQQRLSERARVIPPERASHARETVLRAVGRAAFSLLSRIMISILRLLGMPLKHEKISALCLRNSGRKNTPRVFDKEPFSREELGKGAGLPPERAYYALDTILCAVGREAATGGTLLVDCGVGVLAARGRVKFTFVQVWKASNPKVFTISDMSRST